MQPRETRASRPTSTADLAGEDIRRDDPHRSDVPGQEQTGPRRNASDAFEHPANTTDRATSAATQPRRDFPNAGEHHEGEGSHRDTSPEVLERTEEGTVHPQHHDDDVRSADRNASMTSTATSRSEGPLLGEQESGKFRERWEECQRSFVDEPRDSVKQADELVAEVMQKLARQFAETRSGLERQWDRGSDVSTEDLRVALQRYRDFFNRLLAA